MMPIETYEDLSRLRLNNQHFPTKFDFMVSVGKTEFNETPLYIANSKEIETRLFKAQNDHQSSIELAYSRFTVLTT